MKNEWKKKWKNGRKTLQERERERMKKLQKLFSRIPTFGLHHDCCLFPHSHNMVTNLTLWFVIFCNWILSFSFHRERERKERREREHSLFGLCESKQEKSKPKQAINYHEKEIHSCVNRTTFFMCLSKNGRTREVNEKEWNEWNEKEWKEWNEKEWMKIWIKNWQEDETGSITKKLFSHFFLSLSFSVSLSLSLSSLLEATVLKFHKQLFSLDLLS